jgi:hypothetical protein
MRISEPRPRSINTLLKQDEMSLNRLLVPFVPAEAGTQSLAEFSAPGFPLSRE